VKQHTVHLCVRFQKLSRSRSWTSRPRIRNDRSQSRENFGRFRSRLGLEIMSPTATSCFHPCMRYISPT